MNEKREFVAEVRAIQKEEADAAAAGGGGAAGGAGRRAEDPAVKAAEAARREADAEARRREAAAEAEEAEWVGFVSRRLDFLFHAADPHSLPVPASLGARLLRQAVLVDAELATSMLRSQLLHRVMLFAPDACGGASGLQPQRPRLDALTKRMDEAVKKLNSLCIPTS